MSELDQLWEALEPHVEWPEHLSLIMLFAEHPQGVDELRQRAEGLLSANQRTLRVLVPRDVEHLARLTTELVTQPEPGVGAVWAELWRGSGDADWDRCIAEQLGWMNEVRSLLERQLGRPLVLVLPVGLRTSLYAIAPDLWTIRSFTAVVPSPAMVTRGATEREPVGQETLAVGPPSAVEKEWARILAQGGEAGRVDLRDGFRAVDAAMQRGSLSSARTVALEVFELAQMLAKADSTNAKIQRDLSVSLTKVGDVETEAGNLSAARGHYERSLEMSERLEKADPHSGDAQRDLSISLSNLGRVEKEAGNLSAARGYSQRSLEVLEGLAKADPHSARAQRDLSIALERVGDVEREVGNLSAARGHYARSFEVREGLAKADRHSAQAQRDLSVSLHKLGDVEVDAGNLLAARGHYQRSLELREGLATADPHSAQAQRDLSVSLTKLGDVEQEADNLLVARGHYQRALELLEGLATADPHSARARFHLVLGHLRFGDLEALAGNPAAAAQHIRAAGALMRELDANGHVTGYRQREKVREHLAQLEGELDSR